jgi:hypothetical protein
VSRRPKRRGLAIFLVPEVVIEIAAMAVPTRLALVSDTVDNRAPRRLRLRNLWRGCDKMVGVGGNAPQVAFRQVF